MVRLLFFVSLFIVSTVAIPSFSKEKLWGVGSGSDGSGGILGWPTLEGLGGTGRPTQALFVMQPLMVILKLLLNFLLLMVLKLMLKIN